MAQIEGDALQKLAALRGQKGMHCKNGMHGTDRRGCIGKKSCIAETERGALEELDALQGQKRVHCTDRRGCTAKIDG